MNGFIPALLSQAINVSMLMVICMGNFCGLNILMSSILFVKCIVPDQHLCLAWIEAWPVQFQANCSCFNKKPKNSNNCSLYRPVVLMLRGGECSYEHYNNVYWLVKKKKSHEKMG